jgi:predicted nucleic acid-binding Zn ribbon protein
MTVTPPPGQVSPQGRAHAAPGPVLGSRLCPVCLKNPLQGEQTVCSAACRRRRGREREAERRQLRDAEILALLEHAEPLEARAAELRARACQHLRT